jgi:hypothetical protein
VLQVTTGRLYPQLSRRSIVLANRGTRVFELFRTPAITGAIQAAWLPVGLIAMS